MRARASRPATSTARRPTRPRPTTPTRPSAPRLGRALAAAGRAEEALAAPPRRRAPGRPLGVARRPRRGARGGRPPREARADLEDARAIAGRAAQRDAAAAVRVDLARLHLRRGRAAEALAALDGLADPAARLDAAVTRWCAGAPDAAVRPALEALGAADLELAAPPAVAAAARRWRAWVALAAGDAAAALAALEERPEVEDDAPERRWLLAAARPGAMRPHEVGAVRTREEAAAPPFVASPGPLDGPAPPALPAPSTEPTRPGALVAALHRQARLLLPAAAADAAARERCARLLGRVVALDPDHAAAAADLAWAAGDLRQADRAVARWPGRPEVRAARLRLRLEVDAPAALADDLPLGLHAPGLDESDLLTPLVDALVRRGEHALAWDLLAPWLDAPGTRLALVGRALEVARGLDDPARFARAGARRDAVEDALRRRATLQHQAWKQSDLPAIDGAPFFDVPRDATFHKFRMETATHLNRPVESLLSFGRFLLAREPTSPAVFLARAHSYGWNPQERSAVVRAGLAEALAADPESPVAWLALAAHLASARYRLGPGEAEWDVRHELSDRAADLALEAAARAPTRAGPLLLAAFCLMDAGDLVEAEERLSLAEAAERRPSDTAAFLRARLAALAGDAAGAAAHLARVGKDPQTYESLYRFKSDPAFARVRQAREFALPPGWLDD
ncbi:MAG: hypothetical protein M9894_02090 [Planctomycetes bacterium]|nr:hypothetical protein [Planctomycetota bacterium]